MVLAPEYLRMHYGHMCTTVKRSFPNARPQRQCLVVMGDFVPSVLPRVSVLVALVAPVTYGLTIPGNAAHKAETGKFAAFLLGQRGQRMFAQRGLHPVNPVRCNPCDGLPAELKNIVQPTVR